MILPYLIASLMSRDPHILILGNSITLHPPKTSIDWNGNWGMAASNIDSDYVHILMRKAKSNFANPEFMIDAVPSIESAPPEKTFSSGFLHTMHDYLEFDPDVLVLRLGDNVDVSHVSWFDHNISHLIDTLNFRKNHRLNLIVTSTFFKKDPVDSVLRKICSSNHCSFVNINDLYQNPANRAPGFSNPGVAAHPGNSGMDSIATRIYPSLVKFLSDTLNK